MVGRGWGGTDIETRTHGQTGTYAWTHSHSQRPHICGVCVCSFLRCVSTSPQIFPLSSQSCVTSCTSPCASFRRPVSPPLRRPQNMHNQSYTFLICGRLCFVRACPFGRTAIPPNVWSALARYASTFVHPRCCLTMWLYFVCACSSSVCLSPTKPPQGWSADSYLLPLVMNAECEPASVLWVIATQPYLSTHCHSRY